MFIIWGKKHVTRRLGYVADFCPICRDLRLFKLKRLGLAGHIYYVSFGEGELIGHIRTCAVCDVDLNARPENYKSVHDEKLPAEVLAQRTFPNWKQAYAGRLQLEHDLRTGGKVTPEERRALIREPFLLLAPKVEERFGATHLDWPTAGATAATFFLLALAASFASLYPAAGAEIWAAAWIVGIGAIGVQVYRISGRFFRQKVFPVLVPALRPLRPKPEELEAALQEMKTHGHKIGKKLKLKALLEALERPDDLLERVMVAH